MNHNQTLPQRVLPYAQVLNLAVSTCLNMITIWQKLKVNGKEMHVPTQHPLTPAEREHIKRGHALVFEDLTGNRFEVSLN